MALTAITAGEGQPLALPYGEHMVAGHVIVNKTVGERALLLALGEGTWDAAVDLYYHGEKLPSSAYHFHPGTQSTGPTDPIQGVDGFYPAGITFNRTAYVAIRLPDEFEEVDPSGIVGRYRCKIIADYDESGRQIGLSYSANPARVAADLILEQARISASRIDWASWCAWKQYCDQQIPWNDGKDSTRTIRRFEAHVAFTSVTTLPDALNLLTELSATVWQDTGRLIVFYPPESRAASFVFDESIIVDGSVRAYSIDRRQAPTAVRINFRNLDSEVLAPAQWEYPKPDDLAPHLRVSAGDLQFGAMTYSQAMRLAAYYSRRSSSTFTRSDLSAYGRSLPVLPGDYVQVNHPGVGGLADADVLECEELTDPTDARRFSLALRRPGLYSDLDHEPIPAKLEVQTFS